MASDPTKPEPPSKLPAAIPEPPAPHAFPPSWKRGRGIEGHGKRPQAGPTRKGPPPLTVYEAAFIDAYLGQGKYSASRAAKIVGLSETHAARLMNEPRIKLAMRYRLRGKILPADAIKAELSDVAACEFREGLKDAKGRPIPTVGAQHKVKALEVLARIQGLDRDPALIVLERLMMRQAQPETEGPETGNPRALLAASSVIDAELIDASSALDEGAELAARARAEEEARKLADAATAPSTPTAPHAQAAPEFPPLRLPSPPEDTDPNP